MKENSVNEMVEKQHSEEAVDESTASLPVEDILENAAENTSDEEESDEVQKEPIKDDAVEEEQTASFENMNKQDESLFLVEQARTIVNEAENQLDQCKLLLASDLDDYESAKASMENKALNENESLLKALGIDLSSQLDTDEEMVVFEPKEELEPIVIQNVSSGVFSGFILALIAGFMTLAGLVYLATEKTGITLDVSKVPTMETLHPIMQWYASLVGMGNNPPVGASLIVLVVVIVMWIVYKIRVGIRAGSNLRMAREQLAAAKHYSAQKGTCKEEMDKVDAYIKDAIDTLKGYEVILGEQKGKLARILHYEQEKIASGDFHPKSNTEVEDTRELIMAIQDFVSVPMSEEGKLSAKSTGFLHRAKAQLQHVLDRLYA